MFQDPFERTTDSPMAPAEVCFAITPSDVLDLPRATKAIYVGLAGDVAQGRVGALLGDHLPGDRKELVVVLFCVGSHHIS